MRLQNGYSLDDSPIEQSSNSVISIHIEFVHLFPVAILSLFVSIRSPLYLDPCARTCVYTQLDSDIFI